MSEMAVLCIIGARKGSKRVSNKNRLLLKGKPLYIYAVEAAINSDIFSRILFTTDDEKILKDLKTQPDILIDHRPSELAGDKVVMWDVGLYLLEKYSDVVSGVQSLCFLTPCHPFRTGDHIRKAYQFYKESGATSLVSITQYPFPPELSLELIKNRVVRKWSGPARSNEYRKKYYPNGAISIVSRDYFATHQDVYSPNTVGYEVHWPYCLDIDYEEDYVLAQKLTNIFF